MWNLILVKKEREMIWPQRTSTFFIVKLKLNYEKSIVIISRLNWNNLKHSGIHSSLAAPGTRHQARSGNMTGNSDDCVRYFWCWVTRGVKGSVDWGTLFAQGLILHQGWDYHGSTLGHSMSFRSSISLRARLAGHKNSYVATFEVDCQWSEVVGGYTE